jgi:hypothetical protein
LFCNAHNLHFKVTAPFFPDHTAWNKTKNEKGRKGRWWRLVIVACRYDPLTIKEPGAPGYGAGSKQPSAMLAFLKHCYIHISRQQALSRWVASQDVDPRGTCVVVMVVV